MTSSNGNIFRVTSPLCGEFTGPGEFPAQRPVTQSFDVFFDLRPNKRLGWVNNREAGDLRRHHAHCDVIVMKLMWLRHNVFAWIQEWAIGRWLGAGVPAHKLMLGIAAQGRTFTLKNESDFGVGAETRGHGKPGPMIGEKGVLSLFEVTFITDQPDACINSLAPERRGSNFKSVIFKLTIHTNNLNTRRDCSHVNVIEPDWSEVNIGSGNGLVPSGNKP